MSQVASSDRLRLARDGAMLRIWLNRPDKLNALDSELVEALIAALDEARLNSIRLVVVAGEGKGFSGGFDFTGIGEQSDGDLSLRFLRLEQLLQGVHHAPFLTMALVHGSCFGAAADLVASCTHRIAAPGTRFRMPGLKFGVALGTRRLSEVVGRDAALDILLDAKVFETDEALKMGFLTRVAGTGDWEAEAGRLSASVSSLPDKSFARLLRLTRPDHRNADMAELAGSVAEPGLKQRIEAYLAAMKQAR
ncbi:MAG: enoyl-CoA hydratase/isomerase family protein [Alphaproteobacteria bacterium]|nr:enoyl-CoA hydratase/isomerase family protein [Alphaproteobacteria bacterium]